MSKEKFTAGPWGLDASRDGFDIEPSIAWCGKSSLHTNRETEANARLIAAAPEMYEALKELVGESSGCMQVVSVKREVIEKAIKALKKARGER